MPTLISNYQKRVYVTQLKKSVSVLSQGFTTMMGHDGVTEMKDTEAFGKGFGTGSSCVGELDMGCPEIVDELRNVFSGIQIDHCDETGMKYLDGSEAEPRYSSDDCIKFPDGSELFNISFHKYVYGHGIGYVGMLELDVNGPKNPNTYGRDIFRFLLGNNGTVYPMGSQIVSEIIHNEGSPNANYWRTTTDSMYKCTTDSMGYGCAARVLEEDAMNY